MENNTSSLEVEIDGSLEAFSLANKLKVSYVPVFKFVLVIHNFYKIYSSVKACLLESQ